MMHVSVPIDSTIEFIEETEISPLISKVKIKVCYVSDEPNRNKTVITKALAEELGKKLPGSPIVGYFNQENGDFEQHNKEIHINDDTFAIVDITKPYGFVDINAPVWFQKFIDDGFIEREYLCTEAYLWTDAYPECQRIIDKGNNQSLEFNNENFSGVWTKKDNSNARFFIINEAIIEKLCILGENYEPCFEGAQIKTEFSLDDQFAEMRQTMYSMAQDLHKVLSKGGTTVLTEYAVEIGSTLFDAIYDYLWNLTGKYQYRVQGIYKDGETLFAVALDRADLKMYRLDFSYDETNGFKPAESLTPVAEDFVEVASASTQYSDEAFDQYETEYKAKKNPSEGDEGDSNAADGENGDDSSNDNSSDEGDKKKKKPGTENALQEGETPAEGDPIPAPTYSLDQVVEYQELLTKYSTLEQTFQSLQDELKTLREFKLAADRKEKQAMIDKFYMLSDESKQDVIEHIDTYSLDDIEAKLSVICVRNKVSFVDEDEGPAPTSYNLNCSPDSIEEEWVRAVKEKEKSLNQ